MKLSPKTTSNLPIWEAPELKPVQDESAPQIPSAEILALFGQGQKDASSTGFRTNVHPVGTTLSLLSWLPDDFELQAQTVEREPWEFVETALDSFKTVEPQSVKNKSDVEKEKAQILKDARLQADQILLEAHTTAEQIRHQAQVEYEQKKQEGYQEGLSAAHTELQSVLAAAHDLVRETHTWQADFLKDGENLLIEMLKELAQTMFGEGVRLDADALQINLNRIMENAQKLGDLNIFLNPQDANLLDASWRDYQLLITGSKVRIIPSEKIKPGGCIVKGTMGMVDARVETQLAAVLNTIEEAREARK